MRGQLSDQLIAQLALTGRIGQMREVDGVGLWPGDWGYGSSGQRLLRDKERIVTSVGAACRPTEIDCESQALRFQV